jgi:prepilin-type N-terminal cleavage/methylation domain-containing protein
VRRTLRRGFTLLEILVAMSIVALVLVGMNTFVFSMGELWGRNNDLRLFELHVRNVTRFLQRELNTAAFPPAGGGSTAPIAPKEIRQQTGSTDWLLTFELPKGSRLFTWPERALPDVVCSLSARPREGLFLLWHSRHEKRFEDDPPREVIVTPLVTEMTYDYYDADFKTFKNERTLRKEASGQVAAPHRLRLKFAYGTYTQEAMIALPMPTEGVPAL